MTEEQFNEAMAAYAQDEAEQRKLTAAMDKEMAKVREKYASKLSGIGDRMEDTLLTIESYCVENKGLLFTSKRSMETAHGTVGFRLDPPELKPLPKFTWPKVLEQLRVVLPDYIRTKEEVDKQRLLMDRDAEGVAPHLAECGVRVVQDEQFYVHLKSEDNDKA